MEIQEQENDFMENYDNVIVNLMDMFGYISKDVISAVVENCGGDMNQSVDALVSMTKDGDMPATTQENNTSNQQAVPQPLITYATASQSTGTIPKQVQRHSKPSPRITVNHWTDQLRQIISYHNHGSRILILMRGLPGSGKSYLARNIVEMTVGGGSENYNLHIYSTDNYFMRRGVYEYDRSMLSDAHAWNQNRVKNVLRQGLSPVIVDNTNIELWEMEPYVREGVRNGYMIEVVEPNTPWAKNAYQLSKRNVHNVSADKIRRILEKYQSGVTRAVLMNHFNLTYPFNMVPPVLRTKPAVQPDTSLSITPLSQSKSGSEQMQIVNDLRTVASTSSNQQQETQSELIKNEQIDQNTKETDTTAENNTKQTSVISEVTENVSKDENIIEEIEEQSVKINKYVEVQKLIDEIEKVELEWEHGENWENETRKTTDISSTGKTLSLDPKPQRRNNLGEPSTAENLLESVHNCQDWRQISTFMTPWNYDTPTNSKEPEITVVTKSRNTCMEIGDMDVLNSKHKIITATPRDINLFYMSLNEEKIPDKRMLDKSTMTNDQLITNCHRCKNEEKHFTAFRKLFKNISEADLRDIFDKCYGDVNWAVDIVLDGMANNQLAVIHTEDTSSIDLDQDQCDCMAAYNIIPDITTTGIPIDNKYDVPQFPTNSTSPPQRKFRRDKILSETSMQLKRQIEQNVVISDNHYSDHCLKIRKMRRGESDETENVLDQAEFDETSENAQGESLNQQESPQSPSKRELSCSTSEKSDDDDSNSSVFSVDIEKTVNINIGKHFVSQLDEMFGRKDMTYPENIVPRISIPISIMNEINALWMESLMYQLDEQAKQSAIMLRQDEEFARALAMKEAELEQEGKEPEVPDFKEIMDMDFAQAVYLKNVAEWRNNEPNDLAARMTREKLYNLFPEVPPDILAELLMAHDNNFRLTVEVLLTSTGNAKILEEKNGINKFVMEKEMERQEKLIAEEKKALSEVEWPLLPQGDHVEMSTVNGYREEADKHLNVRNLSYQKAQECIRRGMTQVANYYSDIATFHKQKYEQASSLAAASLIQVHASNCRDNATIDLHYLRVAEAREALDLFLDKHIQKLKENANKIGLKYHTLYFITGRGLHSIGGPRVKPAVKRRLRERKIIFTERNPGLLTARVSADNKLTYELPT